MEQAMNFDNDYDQGEFGQAEPAAPPAKKKLTREQRVEAFKAAVRAAEGAEILDRGRGDYGTCNFDTAVFPLDGARKAQVIEDAKLAGADANVSRWMGKTYVFLDVGQHRHQGGTRTKMAEAARKALQANGIGMATVYYQMD